MTITSEMIYWITRLDSAHHLLYLLTAVFACVGFLCLIGVSVGLGVRLTDNDEDYNEDLFKVVKRGLLICSIVLVCVGTADALLPTTKEMAMIYVVPKIINSDFVQEDLPKDAREIYDLAKQAVVKQLTGEEKK